MSLFAPEKCCPWGIWLCIRIVVVAKRFFKAVIKLEHLRKSPVFQKWDGSVRRGRSLLSRPIVWWADALVSTVYALKLNFKGENRFQSLELLMVGHFNLALYRKDGRVPGLLFGFRIQVLDGYSFKIFSRKCKNLFINELVTLPINWTLIVKLRRKVICLLCPPVRRLGIFRLIFSHLWDKCWSAICLWQ
jgi:hypothetical protein